MKITNNLGLPEPFVRAVEAGEKKERVADYSVTEVIKPPRMLQLERRHKAEMVADASSRVWLLIGKAIHSVLEMAGVKVAGELVEKTMVLTVELGSGAKRTVSGTPDNHTIIDGTLSDWKVTSVWSFLKDKPEWVAQLNLYKYMLEIVEKLEVQRIQIVAILRDWSVTRSYEKNYPECAVAVLPLEIWTKGQTGSYLGERLELHVAAETVPDSALPQCSPQERWEKPPTYAVKKPEAKSAYRNFRVAREGPDRQRSRLRFMG